jgi:antitoxin CcdA
MLFEVIEGFYLGGARHDSSISHILIIYGPNLSFLIKGCSFQFLFLMGEFCPNSRHSKVALLDGLSAAIFNMRIMNAHSFRGGNMQRFFDQNATKKPTKLSVNSDLLSKARKQKINLSATLEHVLESEFRKVERENWLNNNRKAMNSLNKMDCSLMNIEFFNEPIYCLP